MIKNVFGYVLVLLMVIGCKSDQRTPELTSTTSESKLDSKDSEYVRGEHKIRIENDEKSNTSVLKVDFKGRALEGLELDGKVKREFISDLNGDSYNEVYLIVERGQGIVLKAVQLENESVVSIEKIPMKFGLTGAPYDYVVERGQLIERYTVDAEDGKKQKKEVKYNVVKNGDRLELQPQGFLPIELKNMGGQYAARDAAGAGYYKVMLLKQLGGGRWSVDIKVKRNGDKKILCDFVGYGYFEDSYLYVPLSEVNPTLKGSLKIRFIDLLAAVYTADPDDNKEMISFCPGVGSIAGNFKKTNL